jgi:Winged helix DNA-binding domain
MLARIGAAMEKTRVQPSLCSICSYILPIVSCGSPRRSCSLSPRSIGAVRPVATGVAGARAVGSRSETATKDIGRLTTLGKIKVSRACRDWRRAGLSVASANPYDRRERIVSLTAQGRVLYRRIVSLALKREATLLRC